MKRELHITCVLMVLVLTVVMIAPAINLTENSLLITDLNRNSGGTSPCTAPGRIFHVRDLTPTGWQAGPTVAGLTFDNPNKFSLDSSGRIYIADRDNRRIVRMDDVAGDGWTAFSGVGSNVLSMLGTRTGCVDSNYGVYSTAIDSSGRIYTSASNPQRIIRINDMTGAGWTTFELSGGDYFSARAIALDAQGRLYISDNAKHRIIRVNDMQGTGLVTFGSLGNGVGQFHEPEGIAADAQGRIYISDENNHRIVRINDMTGAGWTTFGSYGSGVGQLSMPHGIALDTLDRIYVNDTANYRIVRINSMSGAGWVTFGNRELQGRDFQLNASKGIRAVGQGAAIPYISVFPQVAVGGNYRTSIIGVNISTTAVNADVSFAKPGADASCASIGSPLPHCAEPFPIYLLREHSERRTRFRLTRAALRAS